VEVHPYGIDYSFDVFVSGTPAMSLWAVFLTGLLAGGASCAAVQGGLLAGAVSRRRHAQPALVSAGGTARPRASGRTDDVVPVAGFLAGKLVSHALLGAALGALGGAVELGFEARSLLQIAAGVVMVVLAANLLGVRAVRRVVPQPPASWGRLVRRSGHWGGALGPGVLGLTTVLIPCGVTLSMEFLAVASGSAVSGAAVMVAFVIGTTPLFAALGYVARRSSTMLRGRLSVLAGVAVLIAGLLSLNTGLTLRGSSFTLSSAWRSMRGRESAPVAAAPVAADGTQRLLITVRPRSYTPAHLVARAGVPTQLVLHSDGATGCTSAIVFPTLHVERILPAEGDTVIDVGRLQPGTHRYTCSMGMYTGTIEAAS
jgi:sulfite exporter TauE/SafE